ncbi:hypothetical protein ACSNOJ_09115 [Streptomyces sp. URMC 128]|uniref:hypothetical protein n=1 Tax=Streptomyces sp. URMC 128 TaxID=3423404 RepID=UPI003F1D15AF
MGQQPHRGTAGPPAASATHLYVASPSGRVVALDAVTGKVEGTRSGRDDGGRTDNTSGAPSPWSATPCTSRTASARSAPST